MADGTRSLEVVNEDACQDDITETGAMVIFTENCREEIQTNFRYQSIHTFLQECTVLDPRFKASCLTPQESFDTYNRLCILAADMGPVQVKKEPETDVGTTAAQCPDVSSEAPPLPAMPDIPSLADGKETRLILVGQDCQNNQALRDAIEKLDFEALESETGAEYIEDSDDYENVFVVGSFSGEVFQRLSKAEVRIVGPPFVMKCARDDECLPYNIRPCYCTSMKGLKVCFSGFKKDEKPQLCELIDLVYYMAGDVRRDFKSSVTHLVANMIGGERYDYAVALGRPIMNPDWIRRLWAERDTPDFKGDDPNVTIKYKLPPFYKQCLSFLGFSKDEQNHMEEVTIQNGGNFASVGDSECTHLIIDEAIKELPADIGKLPKHVVKGEWFWACVQMEACAGEKIYTFQKSEGQSNHFTPNSSLTGSHSKSRKRRRLKENIAQLASDEELESPLYGSKRRSSELGGIISPNSFLDASYTPDKSDANLSKVDKDPVKVTARLQVVKEFLQTEKNYVGILHTLLNTFKAQIEKQDQYNGPILDAPDVKLIFGTVPPIYNIHCAIRDQLSEMVDKWHEEQLVGTVISKNAEALIKAYPPFVNFFDDTKERITKCDKTNPRFHAFLKVCLTKPECGRQTLTELLIRPVQRLPSITLLLNDILKHTSKSNPDHAKLEDAANVLKEVMTHINEDRRKTENQFVMFEIMNDIEDCPADVLSSHRSFVSRLDVIALSDVVCRRATPLSIFLFSDCIVICKRRLKVLHSRSPLPSRTPKKGFEHKEFFPLQSIRRVLDFQETEDCRGAFGLIVKSAADKKETFLPFMIDSEDVEKTEFITTLSKHIANTLFRADSDNLISVVEGHQLDVNTKDFNSQTLSKAGRFSRRVSRAFSFNKTPKRFKRAVSQVFSPFVKDSHNNYTPREFRGRRMASTVDLTEDTISLANFEDSDTISLGAFSLKE